MEWGRYSCSVGWGIVVTLGIDMWEKKFPLMETKVAQFSEECNVPFAFVSARMDYEDIRQVSFPLSPSLMAPYFLVTFLQGLVLSFPPCGAGGTNM